MDAACSTADVSPDLRCWPLGSLNTGLKPVHIDENYASALVSASLRMVRNGLPVEVQCLGVRMLQHLVYFRKKELSSTQFVDLRKALVGSLDDLVLKDATVVSDDPMDSPANPKENSKHKRCLLVVLAVNINLRSLAAMETNTVIGTGVQGSLITSNLDLNRCRNCGIWNETSCISIVEDYGFVPVMNHPDSIGDIINACREFAEVAEPAMLVNVEMMSSDQEEGSLLLMEHNVISQAFLTLVSYSGVHQYAELIPCLLSLLNKIWTLPEWRCKYLHHGSGLSRLFSNVQFLKMLLLCIHGLWYPPLACSLSDVLKRAKYLDHTASNRKDSQEKDTRELIEGIRESGYNVVGLCASIDGAFSWLLNRSVSAALSKYLTSLEFRHLSKLIKLTVIPLVKNCPCMFWKEWVDNFLRQLLRHCEDILHLAWSKLLYHGCAGASYYFGKLSGVEESKTLEMDILLEFTREVSGLLEVVALTEQSRAPLEGKDTTSFQDSMPSNSLLRYLVIDDCFVELRMSLFGYFMDDTSTAKAIPFCRALVCLAVRSDGARLRTFILDNLLPCLIQHLDNKLPCAIQRLKSELSLNGSDNASRDLFVLCQEVYGYMLNCGCVQTQDLVGGDKKGNDFENSFEVWLGRQKDMFRAKAYSATARVLSFGHPWRWEFEDECQRYLSVYIDMLLEVDATSEFAEDIYVDKALLFQKLRPEFRTKYGINSCAHPHMHTISSIQRRKFYSMDTVVRNKKICNVARQLIKLKPYIKGSDHPRDVIYRLRQTPEIPAEFSKYLAPSVELLLRSVLFWEPVFHPMIREAQMKELSAIVDVVTTTECPEPLVPTVTDFPFHLQPYAHYFIETKLKEPKYYIAKQQTSLHEEFDEYLASGKLDDVMDQFLSSKDDFVESAINKMVPSKFRALDFSLIKLSLERRAEIVHLQTDMSTYAELLRGLLASEPLKVQAQCLISQLEAQNFFDVDSTRVDWGRASFSELVCRFNSDLFPRNSLPKHYAIRGLIDCRTILLQKGISLDQAFKKVVVDVHNNLNGCLQMFWKDTRYYRHKYYDIIRDPLRQLFSWSAGS